MTSKSFPQPDRPTRSITRRRFLVLAGALSGGAALLAACRPSSPVAAPTAAPAKPAESKPAESKPAADSKPAAAPTQAAPAAQPAGALNLFRCPTDTYDGTALSYSVRDFNCDATSRVLDFRAA